MTTGPRTFEAKTIRTGPITTFLGRIRDWFADSSERRASRSERPHDGWTR